MGIEATLSSILKNRAEKKTLRSLKIVSDDLIDFSSNDYLGLSHISVNDSIEEARGTGGSRLLSGNKKYHQALEEKLALIFNAPSFLLFNSGYVANLGLLASVPQKGDLILMDEYAHVCIKEGARLSRAKYHTFKHNDLIDLEGKLKRSDALHKFIVVESVYSMDGDEAPLQELVFLAKKYQAELIVDEAHSTGLYQSNGSGYCVNKGFEKDIFARIYTFGKAIGAHGAGVAGSETLIQYLLNYSRPFIYTTSLPEHSISAIDNSFSYIQSHPEMWQELIRKVDLFRDQINTGIPLLNSHHPIQGVICESAEETHHLAEFLQSKGFDIRPIVSPTVPQGLERVRICLHLFNSDEEILSLSKAINQYFSN